MSNLTRKDVHVIIYLIDTTILKGTVVVDRNLRLSDMLNNHNKTFIVLTDYQSTHHILNKRHIVKVIEVDSLELEE